MENTEMIYALAEPKQSKAQKLLANTLGFGTAVSAIASVATTQVFAQGGFGEDVTLNVDGGTDANAMMSRIIGILLSISKYVGVALVVYGVYEVIMSFMQNQPEAKTKGIVMALAGAVMITLKSILGTLGLTNQDS